MSIETLTTFFGWCSVINICLLTFSAVFVVTLRKTAVSIHSKMFNLEEDDLKKAYFNYLALYKIVTIIFNIVPWIALKIMSS